MFDGTVNFVAKIKGNGLTFPLFDFNPNEPGVDRIEIGGPNGDEIRSAVHLRSVATQDDGRALAGKVNTSALDRISFFHSLAVENARITGDQFSSANPPPGVLAVTPASYLFLDGSVNFVLGISSQQLKIQLEQPTPPGEPNFGLLRSARQSYSPVEEFVHLYNVLLMLFNDRQVDVDSFIVAEEPAVPQSQHPQKSPGKMETVYTRIRNELAHPRAGVVIDQTKAEMADRLSGLIALTKLAIEMHP